MQVVGLDGWRGGWVAIELVAGEFAAAAVFATIDEVLAAYGEAAALAADMPIGLPASGVRAADRLARQLVGARRSAVFNCPPRDVLAIDTYAEANALAKARHGFGISKQSYMLRPKILELDDAVGAGASFYEAHPEVAFRAIVGCDLPAKKSYQGQRVREGALKSVGILLPDDLGSAGMTPPDDVIDAAAVAYVAHRIASGDAVSLPDPPETDAAGRPMAIWF